jgi:hypothetical protein
MGARKTSTVASCRSTSRHRCSLSDVAVSVTGKPYRDWTPSILEQTRPPCQTRVGTNAHHGSDPRRQMCSQPARSLQQPASPTVGLVASPSQKHYIPKG